MATSSREVSRAGWREEDGILSGWGRELEFLPVGTLTALKVPWEGNTPSAVWCL
jgi:hypothetical protein